MAAERCDCGCSGESVRTSGEAVPRVATGLRLSDRLGAWRVRWGIGRMDYTVSPGLYAVGDPTPDSPVFVSANYKMSFDRLRSSLSGIDGWIMVLDTKGVNVWCAAGKGTFGTNEIVSRLEAVHLPEIVSHRVLIVPQLGAPGVSAHEVKRRTGFRVVYGPVRAEDLRAFLDSDMKATPEMRLVRFTTVDRLVLVPMELIGAATYAAAIAAGIFVLAGLSSRGYSLAQAWTVGLRSSVLLLGAYLAGGLLTPLLLPWLPGRSFAAKGVWAGLLAAPALYLYWNASLRGLESPVSAVAWLLAVLAISSFLGMNFTGASTYTSLSGVRREMRAALPAQIACTTVGFLLWLAARFV